MVKAYQAHGMDPYIMENNRFLFERPFAPTELPYVVLPEGGFYNTNSNDLVNYYFRHNLSMMQPSTPITVLMCSDLWNCVIPTDNTIALI